MEAYLHACFSIQLAKLFLRTCACVSDLVQTCTGNLRLSIVLIIRLEVSTRQSQSHSFPFSSFLLGLGLILVLSHQLLHHRHCPASLPHKVSLEECADKISSLLRECLLFLIHLVLVLCCTFIIKFAIAAVTLCTYVGLCPVIDKNPGHLPFN